MAFDRCNLPDPSYRQPEGLKPTPRGKCKFHGGSDSMRINTEFGA